MRPIEIGEQALALLQSPSQKLSFTAVLMTLINELMSWDAEIIFILDDYHLITEQSIHV